MEKNPKNKKNNKKDSQKKPFYKTLRFWQIMVLLILLAVLTAGLYVGLRDSLRIPGRKESRPQAETDPALTAPPPPENPYGALDFHYEGDYLACSSGESHLGIDVSYWQGDIDWQQVKDAGVEFVIIRVAYRGSGIGKLEADTMAQANYEGARAAGLKVGAYVFSQAITPEEAVEEADFALDLTKDWEMDMPLVYDWEYIDEESRTAGLDPRTLTDCTAAFCRTVVEAGRESMIYFNADQSHKQMYLSELVGYGFWLAMYGQTMDYPYKIDMWQYTNSGTVPGINGNVDLNLQLIY